MINVSIARIREFLLAASARMRTDQPKPTPNVEDHLRTFLRHVDAHGVRNNSASFLTEMQTVAHELRASLVGSVEGLSLFPPLPFEMFLILRQLVAEFSRQQSSPAIGMNPDGSIWIASTPTASKKHKERKHTGRHNPLSINRSVDGPDYQWPMKVTLRDEDGQLHQHYTFEHPTEKGGGIYNRVIDDLIRGDFAIEDRTHMGKDAPSLLGAPGSTTVADHRRILSNARVLA